MRYVGNLMGRVAGRICAVEAVVVATVVSVVGAGGVMAADAIPSSGLNWSDLADELFTKLTPALTSFAGIALGVAIVVAAVRWIRSAVR